MDFALRKSYVTYSFRPPTRLHHDALESPHLSEDLEVTVSESRNVIAAYGTTGLRTWEAALHLATYLTTEEGSRLVRSRKVLELGAGTGLLSILCAKHLGAASVTATDGDESVIEALESNIFLNFPKSDSTVTCRPLKWGRTLTGSIFEEEIEERPYDIVLGADIVSKAAVCDVKMLTAGDTDI